MIEVIKGALEWIYKEKLRLMEERDQIGAEEALESAIDRFEEKERTLQEWIRGVVERTERKRQSSTEEDYDDTTFRKLIGGSSDGELCPVSCSLLTGNEVVVGGEIYVLAEDGELHFSASRTVGKCFAQSKEEEMQLFEKDI
jgi:hypothetical protein